MSAFNIKYNIMKLQSSAHGCKLHKQSAPDQEACSRLGGGKRATSCEYNGENGSSPGAGSTRIL